MSEAETERLKRELTAVEDRIRQATLQIRALEDNRKLPEGDSAKQRYIILNRQTRKIRDRLVKDTYRVTDLRLQIGDAGEE